MPRLHPELKPVTSFRSCRHRPLAHRYRCDLIPGRHLDHGRLAASPIWGAPNPDDAVSSTCHEIPQVDDARAECARLDEFHVDTVISWEERDPAAIVS